jgi:hypothetical protein
MGAIAWLFVSAADAEVAESEFMSIAGQSMASSLYSSLTSEADLSWESDV